MTPEFFHLLCCPESRQPLALAAPESLERLNALIARGQCRNRAGQLVTDALASGLVREDGRWLYPVRGGIPVLLTDEALGLVAEEPAAPNQTNTPPSI